MEDTFSATGSLCVPVDNDGCFTLSEHRHRRSTALVELKLLVARSKAAAEASLRPLASLLQSKKGSFRTLLGDFDRVVDAARSVCASQTLLQPVQTQPNQRRRGSVLPRSSRDAQDDRAPSASERQQRRDREVTIAELIVRCFLLGVPMELLQRLLQASILLQARHGRGCVPGSDVKRCETDGLAILQFFHHRLHSVLASSSDHPQLSWLVERTIASAQRVARGPSPAPSNDATSFEKRSSQTPVCANPMCLQKIQGHRYSHHGINAMRARRSAGRGLLRMDRLADPVFRDQTDDAGVGDGHRSNNRRRIRLRAKGRVCWKCATTPQAIFTTKQFPFGYKYCTSCRCFHKLLHFIDGQARARHHCGQANESAANNNAASALDQTGLEQEGADGIDRQATISIDHATGCVRSTCHASRQFYHMVDRPLAETCTQPSAVQSVGSTTDTATTIGPYSNPQHRHEDVQRFLHPRGQLWKHKSAALGSARRSHNRNLNSSQTAQPSRSSHLAKKVVKRVLLSASFLSANPDIVQSVDCSGQNALAALLEAKIARSIAAAHAEAQALPHAADNATSFTDSSSASGTGSGGGCSNDVISVVCAVGTPQQMPLQLHHQTGSNRKRSLPPQDSACGRHQNRRARDAPHLLPSFLYRGNGASSSVQRLCGWAAARSHALRLRAMRTFFSQNRSQSDNAESSGSQDPPRRRRRP